MAIERITPHGNIPLNMAFIIEALATNGEGFLVETERPESDWLPPREAWRIEPGDRVQVPVDEHGLVKRTELINTIKSLVDPNYRWPMGTLSIHHEYWNRSWYGLPSAGKGALEFRELSINKVLVPRVFENFLHVVVEPPDVPHIDVMNEVIRGYKLSKSLYGSIWAAIRCERGVRAHVKKMEEQGMLLPPEFDTYDARAQATLLKELPKRFEEIYGFMNALDDVSPEFRLVEPDMEVLGSHEKRRLYASTLGRIFVPKAMPMTRAFTIAA